MKKIIKAIGLCLGVIVLAAAAFILYLFVTDYRPQDEEEVVLEGSGSRAIAPGDALSVLTFNIGYGGLDADTDFFMDGYIEGEGRKQYFRRGRYSDQRKYGCRIPAGSGSGFEAFLECE